ncbi:hypothetical protein C8R45DRAFT_1021598 [Mycena sanguinolenta]|nr:hypothetical protein C8R45DRAFT_1021598 [Mycena sanguinolenta]
MELALTELRAKRALLQKPIDAHMALISPMRHLPQDVLLEIFSSCLPSEYNALIDPSQAPLLLGRICRHWRDVAYGAPMLWNSIHIPPLHELAPPHILLELERKVAAWLGRSATCPLSVSFSSFINDFGFNADKHPLILQLMAVSRRLRCVVLTGDDKLLRPLLQLGPEDVPLLKRIHIRSLSDGRPFTNILQTPTLEDIALLSVLDNPISLPLQWPLLKRFRFECHDRWSEHGLVGSLDFAGALDVLRQCPHLEQCEIRVNKFSALEDPLGLAPKPPSIILPQMHTLILKGPRFRLEKWRPELVAPNLRFLQIGDVPSGDLLPRTSGLLSVDIDSNCFTTTSLHEFLQSFPMISHLRMSTQLHNTPLRLDNQLMRRFCPPHNLCPMLTDITLLGPSVVLSDTATLTFIKARMAMPTPLHQFRVQFPRPMNHDILPDLQAFISDGLQVALEYVPPWEFKARDGLDGPPHIEFIEYLRGCTSLYSNIHVDVL